MAQYIINLTPEQEKALLIDMISIQEWIDNAIQNKARQCIDTVCEQALSDPGDTILTVEEKRGIVKALADSGRIISTVKQMPEAIKLLIVAAARVKSAAERRAEISPSGGLERG